MPTMYSSDDNLRLEVNWQKAKSRPWRREDVPSTITVLGLEVA